MLTRIAGLLAVAVFVLFSAAPAFAQETAPTAQSGSPAGIGVLILLIGLAALGMVGLTILPRRPGTATANAASADDDELIPDDEQ